MKKLTYCISSALNCREAGFLQRAETLLEKAKWEAQALKQEEDRATFWNDIANYHLVFGEWNEATFAACQIPFKRWRGLKLSSIVRLQKRKEFVSEADLISTTEAAVRTLEKNDPQLTEVFLGIGAIFVNQGKRERALRWFRMAWQTDNPTTQSQTVIALARAGFVAEAIQRYREAASLAREL